MTTTAIMDRLRHLGVILEINSDGNLIVDAPCGVLTSADLEAMRCHKTELLAAVITSSRPSSAAAQADGQNAKMTDAWPLELSDLIHWFHCYRFRLPQRPFLLAQGQCVIDPARFYDSLEGDILTGPCGARAKLGGLKSDLERLKDIFEELSQRATAENRRAFG
jgi:hypothetical protein